MNSSIAKIAMVFPGEDALTRRLANGISRYATPGRGFLVREFIVNEHFTEMPESYFAWAPEAAVCFLSGNSEHLLQSAAKDNRPVVNMSRCSPAPGRGIVLGCAEEVYSEAHKCFREKRLEYVTQYILGKGAEGLDLQQRYQQYTENHKLAFHSFQTEEEPEHIHLPKQIRNVPKPLAKWLHSLPKPAGIFTQNTYAGPFLCRCCQILDIAVPDEIAIIGSDEFDIAHSCEPSLSTIRIPAEEIGKQATQLAVDMIHGKQAPQGHVLVPGIKLIIRASTGGVINQGCNIDRALQFIRDHACEGVKVNDVVEHTQGVSRMTFHKRFVEATGMTPAKAIHEQKMGQARRLLSETKLSVGAIANMCGYADDLYFSQTFRKCEGVAPRDYRKMHFSQ